MMKRILWLASYPKSGNTWFRVFLTNLKRNESDPADINQLERATIASCRVLFSTHTGLEASNLTDKEIDRLRPHVYKQLCAGSSDLVYCKIHDAYSKTSEDVPLVPSQATLGAVYIIRNPLDVVISYADHLGICIDDAADVMADETFKLCSRPGKLHPQLRQRLMSWSKHVSSWVDAPELNVHIMRYEDMHRDPVGTFSDAARFSQLPANKERVKKALMFSSFQVLQEMEIAHGFREKSIHSDHFFRQGKVGAWRKILNQDQVTRICEVHSDVMARFGYLSSSGEIIDFPTNEAMQKQQAVTETTGNIGEVSMIGVNTVVVRIKEVIGTPVDGEMVILKIQDGTFAGLDPISSRIWALMEKPITVSRLCAALMREFDVTAIQCRQDVILLLGKLSQAKLIDAVDRKN